MTRWHIIQGDLRAGALEVLEPESFHAVLCDPPYGLSPDGRARTWDDAPTGRGFMGKAWDAAVPGPAFWRGVLRVLKPGAHVLAFGGTRTYHRTAGALEDAGFELRDMLAYLYGSGFPKSMNLGCRCGGMALPYNHAAEAESSTERAMHVVRGGDVSQANNASEGGGAVLLAGLSEQGSPAEGRKQLPATEVRRGQPGMEGRRDVFSEEGELQVGEIRPVSEGSFFDGPEGRVRDGAQAHHGEANRAPAGAGGGRAPHQSRPSRQQAGEPGTVRHQCGAQEGRGSQAERCEACGGLKSWQGYGTALKPAQEPIALARKPLEGTVAANCLEHGCGGLAIDAGRVATDWSTDPTRRGWQGGGTAMRYDQTRRTVDRAKTEPMSAGRFPANVLLDETAAAMLDEQSGERGKSPPVAGYVVKRSRMATGVDLAPRAETETIAGYGDTGGASRFFYTAKASRREREAGCEGFEAKRRTDGRLQEHETPNLRTSPARNHHPTVKPLSLTTYLARLLLPPPGPTPRRILVPFSGSGSEMIGCLLAGWDEVVGVEMEAEYVAIARARIAHWCPEELTLQVAE